MEQVFQRILDDIIDRDINKKDRPKLDASTCDHLWEYYGRRYCKGDPVVLDKFVCLKCSITIYRTERNLFQRERARLDAGVWTGGEAVTREIIR